MRTSTLVVRPVRPHHHPSQPPPRISKTTPNNIAASLRRQSITIDSVAYLTFWAVAAFSFFLASDALINRENQYTKDGGLGTRPEIIYALDTFQALTHCFALNSFFTTLAEIYILFYINVNRLNTPNDQDYIVARKHNLIEFHGVVAAVALFSLNFIYSISSAFAPASVAADQQLSSNARFLCRLVPWSISFICLLIGGWLLVRQWYQLLLGNGNGDGKSTI